MRTGLVSHYSPAAIFRAMEKADYRYYDADKMELVTEGHVDWCTLNDLCWDEYRIMCDDPLVSHYGLLEVDRPQREGRGMFIVSHHSELMQDKAYPAAKAGLWWHIPSRTADFEKTLEMNYANLTIDAMSLDERDKISNNIEAWRKMFPGDTRVDDFHCEFTLDMITRRRVVRQNGSTNPKHTVWFERG